MQLLHPRLGRHLGCFPLGFSQQGLPHQSFVGHSVYMAQLTLVVFFKLGEVIQHLGLCEFDSCALCREVSHQGRNEEGSMPRTPNHWRAPKSRNNVVRFFFNAIHLLPKYLRFKYGGAKLVSCLGRNLTSV